MKTLKTLLQEITAGIKAWANASFSSGTHVHGNITNNGKLATASKVVISDSNKNITTSNVSDTELGHLSGVTSAIQTQINSKAYDADVVHTTGNETIAGTKTFASTINGTASKAVADEDGNTINSTYGKLAGSQTWTGSNTWTAAQSFKDSTYTQGVGVTDRKQDIWRVTDSTDSAFGTWEAIQYTNNKQGFRLCTANKYKNGALDPTGNLVPVYFEFLQRPSDGSSVLKWTNGFIDNSVYPLVTDTYSFGNSIHQWLGVHAQSYYYNGTQWGLNQDNTWTGGNAFLAGSYNNHTVLANATLDLSNGNPALSETNQGMILFTDKDKWLGKTYARLQSWTATDQTVTVLGATYRPDASTENDFSVWLSNTSNLKSFHPYGVSEPHLGNAAHKWKTLNGINPGALSFPNPDAVIELDTTGWDVAGAMNNTYTPIVNGWLAIDIKDTATSSVFIYSKGLSADKQYSAGVFGNGTQGTGRLSVMLPALANIQYAFIIKAGSLNDIAYVRFYPCLGNV